MPRSARQESSTGLYHIVMRGNNRDWIFKNPKDKRALLDMLFKQEKEMRLQLLAWCIMDNHVHIVLKAELEDLMIAMKKINVSYAMRYNLKNNRVGHVFQDRFKSQPIENDEYLLQVIRYVHQNPVKANMVLEIKDYEWSSYRTYLIIEAFEEHIEMKFIMDYFENEESKYILFHEENDFNVYLDIKEDLEFHQNEKVNYIINNICTKHNITSGFEILRDKKIKEELIEEMIKNSGLSLRKIASVIEVSYGTIQVVNQRMNTIDR